MKFILQSALLTYCLILICKGVSLGQVYPFSANVNVTPPFSSYAQDYFKPVNNNVSVTVNFLDSNEPSWDYKIKFNIKGEGVNISLYSLTQRTIYPGTPDQFTIGDIFPNMSNARFEGGLPPSGQLPDGFYDFSITILDARSSIPISGEAIANVFITSLDEPVVISPESGTVLQVSNPNMIPFQWQLTSGMTANALQSISYIFTLYEVTDLTLEDVQSAINNSQVLKVYERGSLKQTSFVYDANAPVLEAGKRYVYQIQAIDDLGKSTFKNNGKSQVGWFYYGLPTNGEISLGKPENKKNFSQSEKDRIIYEWNKPSFPNLEGVTLPIQAISYHLKVVKYQEGEVIEDVFDLKSGNDIWMDTTLSERVPSEIETVVSTRGVEEQTNYAWRVEATSRDQKIAKSPIHTFRGPQLLEQFYASGSSQKYRVKVDYTSKGKKVDEYNLKGVSGTGVLYWRNPFTGQENDSIPISFQNMHFRRTSDHVNSIYNIAEGEVIYTLEDDERKITLTPNNEENDNAFFRPEKIKFTKEGVMIYGDVEWKFPHSTTEGDLTYIRSDKKWVGFEDYKLRGTLNFAKSSLVHDLIDPLNFRVLFKPTSYFRINTEQEYKIRLDGTIRMPESVKGILADTVEVSFEREEQFQKLDLESPDMGSVRSGNQLNNILIATDTRLELIPHHIVVDLSDTYSPNKKRDKPSWKGVYLKSFSIKFPKKLDNKEQVTFDKDLIRYFSDQSKEASAYWVDYSGLNLSIDDKFSETDKFKCNLYPSDLGIYHIDIVGSTLSDSYLTGSLTIPFFSETEKHLFTIPITDTGFMKGYMEDIAGKEYTLGKGEQKVEIKIKQAIFQNNERLDFILDFNWPVFETAQITNLEGFQAYGNYEIGFGSPKGSKVLDYPVEGVLGESFPIVIKEIGAGARTKLYTNGFYAVGILAEVFVSSDAKGVNGKPTQTYFYSITENGKLPGNIIWPSDSEWQNYKPHQGGTVENKSDENIDTKPATDFSDLLAGAEDEINADFKAQKEEIERKLKANSIAVLEDITRQYEGGHVDFELDELVNEVETQKVELNKVVDATLYANGITEEKVRVITEEVNNMAGDIQAKSLAEVLTMIQKLFPEADIPDEKVKRFEEFIEHLNAQQRTMVDNLVQDIIVEHTFAKEKLLTDLRDDIHKQSEFVKKEIDEKLNIVADKVINEVNQNVAKAVDKLSQEMIEALPDTLQNKFGEVITDYSLSLQKRVASKLTLRIRENIVNKVNQGITDKIDALTEALVNAKIDQLGNEIEMTDDLLNELSSEVNQQLSMLGKEFIQAFDPSLLVDNIKEAGMEVFKEEVKVARIILDLQNQLKNLDKLIISEIQSQLYTYTDSLHIMLTKPINDGVDSLNSSITSSIQETLAPVENTFKVNIDAFLSVASEDLKSSLQNEYVDVNPIVNAVIETLARDLKNQFGNRLSLIVADNITAEITNHVRKTLIAEVDQLILVEMNATIAELKVEEGENLEDVSQRFQKNVRDIVKAKIPKTVESITQGFLDPKKINDAVNNVATNIINELLDVSTLYDNLFDAVKGAINIEDALEEAVVNQIVDMGGDNPYVAMAGDALAMANMDFEQLDDVLKQQLSNEGYSLAIDPNRIEIVTPYADVKGWSQYVKSEDPLWGNHWHANLVTHLKMFSMNMKSEYYASASDGKDYWLLRVKTPVEQTMPPFLYMKSIEGGIYHHMNHAPSDASMQSFQPDENIDYGAFFNVELYDIISGAKVDQTNTSLVAFNLMTSVSYGGNGLTMNMGGEIKAGNFGPVSLAKGDGLMTFNSNEGIFEGNFDANALAIPVQPAPICANANLEFKMGQKDWYMRMGTEQNPITFKLLCAQGFDGWMTFDPRRVDFGARLYFNTKLTAPKLGIGKIDMGIIAAGFYIQPYAELLFDMGAKASIRYSPSFAINHAEMWLDCAVSIGANWYMYARYPCGLKCKTWKCSIKYCTFKRSGSIIIAAVSLGGRVKLITNEREAKIYGKVHGRATFLGVTTGFGLTLSQNFS